MNTRKLLVSAGTTLLILMLGGVVFQKFVLNKKSTVSDGPTKEEIYSVFTEQFPIKTVNSEIALDGRINAVEKISIAAEVSGRLLPIQKSWEKGFIL